MRNEDNTVNVNEEERFDSRPTDIPVIVIERDNGSSANPRHGMSGTPHGKSTPVLWSVVIILLIALAGTVLLYVLTGLIPEGSCKRIRQGEYRTTEEWVQGIRYGNDTFV